jgi:uncharacterized protein (UPF0264 family)
MRILVSVRSVDEALAAADGGADFIDLKEPRAGALGGLPLATIGDIVSALRGRGVASPISATIGDVPATRLEAILQRVDAVARCGVDYVKVGVERDAASQALLHALAACGRPVVPVFIADRRLDPELVAQACRMPFAALMADTADKRAGSVFDALGSGALQAFVHQVRGAGLQVGVAGALRIADLPALAALRPDFAGFRSAVCRGDRGNALDAGRLRELRAAAAQALGEAGGARKGLEGELGQRDAPALTR